MCMCVVPSRVGNVCWALFCPCVQMTLFVILSTPYFVTCMLGCIIDESANTYQSLPDIDIELFLHLENEESFSI